MSKPQFLFPFVTTWCTVILLYGIRYGDLSGYDDAAYAHQARELLSSADIWTVFYNGFPDFDKPPLFVWMVAASFKIFGMSDWAAKLPAALCGIGVVVITYFLAAEVVDREERAKSWIPSLAAMSMATTQYFLKYSGHAMTDVPFTLWFTLAIFLYLRSRRKALLLLPAGVAIGFATLTRSPVGLIPLAIILTHFAIQKRFREMFRWPLVGCVAISLAIPAAWYIHEYRQFGDQFIHGHLTFLREHSAADEVSGKIGILSYFEYIPLLLELYIPWWPAAFAGLFIAVREVKRESRGPFTILVLWIVLVLVPFSFAESKVLRYIMQVFPALAVCSALALTRAFTERSIRYLSGGIHVVLLAAAISMVWFPNYRIRAEDMSTLAPISDSATTPGERVVLFTGGTFRWDYQTQLLWYGHRYCTHFDRIGEIKTLIQRRTGNVVIMDRVSFDSLPDAERNLVTQLGESNAFICFKA